MGFGTESASKDVLALMNKRHEHIEDMVDTARKSELAGIHVTFNVILGYPAETEVDRQQTFRIMSDIAREYWNVGFSPNIFTPYPGIPIWPQLKEMGLKEPQSLEEWETLALGFNVLPWLQGEESRRLRRSLECFLLNNQIRKATKKSVWLRQGFRRALGAPVRWRISKNRYSFPWELWVSRTVEYVTTRRSLLLVVVHAAVWSYTASQGIPFRRGGTRRSQGGVESNGRKPVVGSAEIISVPAVALDHFVTTGGPPPQLVKIDVEGGEYEVLRAAAQTFSGFTAHSSSSRFTISRLPIRLASGWGNTSIVGSGIFQKSSSHDACSRGQQNLDTRHHRTAAASLRD
jgi:FkbM family methyltransferase